MCSTWQGRPRCSATCSPGPSSVCVVVLGHEHRPSARRGRSRDGDVTAERDERSRPGRLGDLAGGEVGRACLRGRAEIELHPSRDLQQPALVVERDLAPEPTARGDLPEAPSVALRHEDEGRGRSPPRGDRHRAQDRRARRSCGQRPTPHERTRAARRSARPVHRIADSQRRARSRHGTGCTPGRLVGHARGAGTSRSPPPWAL